PHMQRITWSGIALHGGPLPGYPASHGCVRLPYDFAARLFDLTRLGMRVIVAPTDVTPIEIAHPALFMPKPGADALAANRAAEAAAVASKAATAKHAAVTASRDAAQARMAIRLYVRRAFEPILEIPVAIQEPERPIGTHVFTATERTNGETG